jgi:hypothetical protein
MSQRRSVRRRSTSSHSIVALSFQDYISTSKRMELLQDFYETTLVFFHECLCNRVARFFVTHCTKNGVKYTKWPFQGPSKFTQFGIFGFENIPSGNPVLNFTIYWSEPQRVNHTFRHKIGVTFRRKIIVFLKMFWSNFSTCNKCFE